MSAIPNGHIMFSRILVTAEEAEECKEMLTFRFEAKNLYKNDFFVNLNPFLVFYRVNEDGTFTVAHRTEYVKKSLNPIWKQFTVSSRKFCGTDRHRLCNFIETRPKVTVCF